MKYGIIGSGSANTKLVRDGLADIIESDAEAVFVIHARRAPQGSVGDVYDYLVDNESPFIAIHRIDDNAPKALLNCALSITVSDDPTLTVIQESDVILLLWDEKNEESSNKMAIMAHDGGCTIKDLTMALTPIVIGDETTTKLAPVEVEPETPELVFTQEELMNMNIGVLRRQAKALGVENVGKTKQEIVDAIFNIDTPVIAADTHEPSNIGNGFFTWLENGEVHTHPLPPIMVKWLIEELKTA
jgi:hypothetical protein